MTPKVPLLSEHIRDVAAEKGVQPTMVLTLHVFAEEVAALEHRLAAGVEGLVPEGTTLQSVTLVSSWDDPDEYEALLLWGGYDDRQGITGTGPTVEAAIENAKERIPK